MQPMTGSTLGQLHCLRVGIATKHLFEVRRLRQYLSEQLRSNPETAALALSHRANRGVMGTKNDRCSDKSLAPRNAYLGRCSIAHHCNERNHSGSGEVHGCDGLIRFPEYFSGFTRTNPRYCCK